MITSQLFQAGTDGGNERSTAAIKAKQLTGTTGELQFYTDASGLQQRMVIDTAGNVGIGAITPGALLNLSKSTAAGLGGELLISNSSVAESVGTYSGISFNLVDSTSYKKGGIFYSIPTDYVSNGRGDIVFVQNAVASSANATLANAVMTIKNNGNIGIGTVSPYGKLDTIGAVTASANYGLLNIGPASTAFDGATAGKFAGSASGTQLAINAVTGFAGNLIDAQVGGASKFSVTNAGVVQQKGCITAGTLSADTSGNIICTLSSQRFKNNIIDLNLGLSSILALRPVAYNFNPDMNLGSGAHFGFISEEVASIAPEFATHDGAGNPYGLDTNAILASTVNAIKELNLNLEGIAGTITPLAGSPAESFVTAFFGKIGTWLADAGNGIANIFAKEVNTNTLCVSDDTGAKTCLTKAQLDTLLVGTGVSSVPTPTPTPTSTPTPSPEPSPTPSPEPTPTPEPSPTPTPDNESGSTNQESPTPTPSLTESPMPTESIIPN